jgi:8-oxo-dGTP pyrophosphatase MutT (NUDIX family)
MPHKRTNKRKGPGQQYAALPCIEIEGETRVMLVTSRETGRWVLPKGWAEKGLSRPELAAKEAFEEAGILGEVSIESAGSYTYPKRSSKSRIIECKVDVFPMRVGRLLDDWPERKQRKRR